MAQEKKYSRKQLDAAMEVAMKLFSHRRNITGFDVGYRWTGDQPTKELCVRVHVKEKIPLSELETTEIFPKDIDGIPLDVIQGPYKINKATQPSDHQRRLNVLMGGISCSRTDDGTGTLGAIVIDKTNGAPVILSNWHVLVGARGQAGDPILQPGTVDLLAQPANIVAELSRSILDHDGDAAIATISGSRKWVPIQYGSNHSPTEIRDSRLGEVLQKSGRTTGRTRGRVDGEGVYRIEYEVRPGIKEIREIRGFKIVPEIAGNPNNDELSSSGDSGCLWESDNGQNAVGLHFAGETNSNPAAEHAIACNMTSVSKRLNIKMATFDDFLELFDAQTEMAFPGIASPAIARNPEFTPVPDGPDGPWGGPYPCPWPGGGPWPWPPTGPIGPLPPISPWDPRIDWSNRLLGGEIPWPLKWKGWAQPTFPVGGISSFPNVGFGTGSETTTKTISRKHYIWPALRAAIKSHGNITVKKSDPISRVGVTIIAAVGFISTAVNYNSSVFASDKIKTDPIHFMPAQNFSNVVYILGKFYKELGHTVVT